MKRCLVPFVVFFAASVAGCHRTPDEQLIRDAIGSMQQALENGSPRDFMSHVDTDFTGQEGRFDRNGLHNLLRVEVLRNDKIGVILGPIDIQMHGGRATVHVSATFTGGPGGWLPERGALYTFTSGWRKHGSDWYCYNASWRRKL
ncbi:MAG TPA: hypothetical protein VKA94_08280 [Hyphomicrobiales bacterium]|nr:hypothetical protein [Hyphomicrobiales bacterium]